MSIIAVVLSVVVLFCLLLGAVDDLHKKICKPPSPHRRRRYDSDLYVDGFMTAVTIEELHDMFDN